MRNRYILLADLPIIALAALGAFVLRFDWFFRSFQREFILYVIAAIVLKPMVFHVFRMYGRYWRYASIQDFIALGLAVSTASLVMAIVVGCALVIGVVENFARSVVLIDWLLTLVATGAVRVSVRIVGEARANPGGPAPTVEARRILIAGAGDAGAMVAREMGRNRQLGMVPVGFVDDDPVKHGKRIYGLPVFGPISELADIVRGRRIDEVTIAMPSVAGRVVRAIADMCRDAGVPSRTMPGMFELLDGNVSISRLRDIDINDLLRRTEVEQNSSAGEYVAGRTVLVTGAGGSIGLELCRQVAHRQPGLLVLLGHGENSLFDAHAHLRTTFPAVKLKIVVADIRDDARIARVFRRVRPDVVFHAAAHKHVPLMEENPEEAVSNNVLGTRNVVQAALDVATERLVLISSDKAVSPSSLMGASKRLAEGVVQAAARRHRRAFVVVRFGNVLGSRGSVVPVFKQQIEHGGPITITHPEMRRFFMTIPEAVHLVLEAGGMGTGGELFVLKMGDPVRIVDLAQDLIRLSGPSADGIAIEFTGVRPGEKLEEALWEAQAEIAGTTHAEVLQVREPAAWPADAFDEVLESLQQAVAAGEPRTIEAIIAQTIPAFASNRPSAVTAFRVTTSGGGRS
jgi:FlaA1/EpsC-like NDP-sugar epimerase